LKNFISRNDVGNRLNYSFVKDSIFSLLATIIKNKETNQRAQPVNANKHNLKFLINYQHAITFTDTFFFIQMIAAYFLLFIFQIFLSLTSELFVPPRAKLIS